MKHQHKQTGGEETMQLNSLVNECMKVVVLFVVSILTDRKLPTADLLLPAKVVYSQRHKQSHFSSENCMV